MSDSDFVGTDPSDSLAGSGPTPNTSAGPSISLIWRLPFGTGTEAANRPNLFGRSVNLTLNPGPPLSRRTITPDPGHGRVGRQTGGCRTGP